MPSYQISRTSTFTTSMLWGRGSSRVAGEWPPWSTTWCHRFTKGWPCSRSWLRLSESDRRLSHQPAQQRRELAEAYAEQIRQQLIDLGIAKDLGLDLTDLRTASLGAKRTRTVTTTVRVIGHDILHQIEELPRRNLRDQTHSVRPSRVRTCHPKPSPSGEHGRGHRLHRPGACSPRLPRCSPSRHGAADRRGIRCTRARQP